MRIGHGYDVHRLVSGRKLILGGVGIPFEKGLDGHSDADVLTHAVMRRTEGAALEADLRGRAQTILGLVEKVEQRSPVTLAEYRARLTQKMEEVLGSTDIDESRILQEAALYADKIAVDEETVRLRSHLSQLETMAETLHDANGVGLAGPQVGVLRRVVVVDTGDEDLELVNPEIIEKGEETQTGLEGCLSVPGEYGVVTRPNHGRARQSHPAQRRPRDGAQNEREGGGRPLPEDPRGQRHHRHRPQDAGQRHRRLLRTAPQKVRKYPGGGMTMPWSNGLNRNMARSFSRKPNGKPPKNRFKTKKWKNHRVPTVPTILSLQRVRC